MGVARAACLEGTPMRVRRRLLVSVVPLLAVVALGVAPAPAQAAATTGPSVAYQLNAKHDGYSADTRLVTPLAKRWSRDLPGFSSYPLIAQGRVYVTAADHDAGGDYGSTLYALDEATGATVWSREIGGRYYWSNAALDAGRVFVVNYDGLLTALDAGTGALIWSTQLTGQHAFSGPPTAAGGTVYLGGAGSGGTLYAVRETDGAVRWTQTVANGDASSPALSATTVFVTYACGLVYAFDRVTGAPTWYNGGRCEGFGGSTPVLHNGRVYSRDPIDGNETINATTGATVGTFQADPAPAFAGSTGVFLHAGVLRATSGSSPLWSFTGDGGLVTAPIIVGDTVYAGSSTGRVYGLALATGKQRWTALTGAPIYAPYDGSASAPLTGLGAGDGLLVVPAGHRLVAYAP